MQKAFTTSITPKNLGLPIGLFVKALLLTCLTCAVYICFQHVRAEEIRLEMSSGKNGKHANPKAQKSAEEQYKKAKEAFDNLSKKPKKSKEDNKTLEKLKKQVQRWRQKKDWSGENHSQKHKGN